MVDAAGASSAWSSANGPTTCPEGRSFKVNEMMEPTDGTVHVRSDDPLEALLGNQTLRRLGALMAVDATAASSGIITAEQVGRALREAPGTGGG